MVRSLLLCGVISAAICGCASTAPQSDAKTRTAAVAPQCAAETGSRIHRDSSQCSASPSRTYTRDDIERTGSIDTAEALRLLDPTITVHH